MGLYFLNTQYIDPFGKLSDPDPANILEPRSVEEKREKLPTGQDEQETGEGSVEHLASTDTEKIRRNQSFSHNTYIRW